MGDTTKNWVIQVNDSLTKFPDAKSESVLWKKRSIYNVAPCGTELNKKAYRPQAVSFGPYHNGDEHLMPMEEHNLLRFLWCSGKPLDKHLDSLCEVVGALMECYDALESPWKDDSEGFLRLMIHDGCFMLEILEVHAIGDYVPNDPFFNSHGKLYIMPFLRRDMLMIENRLPILLLERLVTVESNGKKVGSDDLLNARKIQFG